MNNCFGTKRLLEIAVRRTSRDADLGAKCVAVGIATLPPSPALVWIKAQACSEMADFVRGLAT